MKKLIFYFSLLTFSSLLSQHCGSPMKTNIISPYLNYPTNLTIKDRFGNSFDFDDIKMPSTNISPNGNNSLSLPYQTTPAPRQAGLFTIYFAPDAPGFGFAIDSNRDVVCQVFRDISRLILDVNPADSGRVKIWVASNIGYTSLMNWPIIQNGSVVALASSFQMIPNGLSNSLIDNEVGKTIKGGKNSYIGIPTSLVPVKSDSLFHGYIGINFSNNNWFKKFKSNSIDSNQDDLYSTVLHEAFHLLGISTELTENGAAKKGANLYSLIDQFYTVGNNSSNKIISFNNVTKAWSYTGGVSSLVKGCGNTNSIFYNSPNILGQTIYTGSSWEQGSSLSHLSCSNAGCAGYATNYSPPNDNIMAYCGGKGADFIKRHPNVNETKILCDLGYSLKSIGGVLAFGEDTSNSTVYQTYTSCTATNCYAVGYLDSFYSTSYNTAKTIPLSSILGNDKNANFIDSAFKVIPSYAGSVILSGNNLVYTPSNDYIGQSIIGYYPKCTQNGIRGSIAYFFMYVNYPTMLTCNTKGYCNMLCNGDFELGTNPYVYSDLILGNGNGSPLLGRTENGKTCYWENSFGLTKWCNTSFNTPACFFNSNLLKAPEGKQFMLLNSYGSNLKTAVLFELDTPMTAGNTYKVSFLGRKQLLSCPSPRIEFYGDSIAPCPRIKGASTLMDGSPDPCGFSAKSFGYVQIDTNDWKNYSMTINPSSKIYYLIVYVRGDYPGAVLTERTSYIDNFELYQVNTPKIEITATPVTTSPCIDSSSSVSYKLCLDVNTLNADSIIVQLNIPNGINILPTSNFNANGRAFIPKNTISKTNCITLNLNYSFGSSVSPNFPYDFDILATSDGLCQSTSSDNRITVTPISNTLTYSSFFTDTSSYFGDTVTYYLKACNTGDRAFDKVQYILDSMPSGFKILDSNGFKKSGNILFKTIDIPAANITGSIVCILDSIILLVSSCGNLPICSRISQGLSSCVKNIHCANLIVNKKAPRIEFDPIFPELCQNIATDISANTTPTCSNCSYEWKYNGNVIGTTKTVSVNQLGSYQVKIIQVNGCISHIDSVSLKLGKDTIKTNAIIYDTTCTNYQGKISLNPFFGSPPYKYLWSNGKKDSFIDSLVPNRYIVKVSDRNGCSILDTFAFSFKTDTLQVNVMILQPLCVNENGFISLTPHHSIFPYSVSWDDDTSVHIFSRFLPSGTYNATVTDGRGCSKRFQFVLTNPDFLYLASKNIIDTNYHVKNFANQITKTLILDNSTNLFFKKNLIVDSGYNLIIRNNSHLQFSTESMLEVQNTSKLTILNSNLTAKIQLDTCKNVNTWQGIRIFPYDLNHSYVANNYSMYLDTPLILLNGNIQHAKIAINSGLYYADDVLDQNGMPVIHLASSKSVLINNTKFLNNERAIKFTSTFGEGGFLSFENNIIDQTNANYIKDNAKVTDIYFYERNQPLVSLTLPQFPAWEDKLYFNHNTISTIKENTKSNTALRLDLGGLNANCHCIFFDDVNFKNNKFSGFKTGLKFTNVPYCSFVNDTFENCQYGLNLDNSSTYRIDSSYFENNSIGVNINTNNNRFRNDGSTISNNSFIGIKNYQNNNTNINAKAIYLNGTKALKVYNNTISQSYINPTDKIASYTGIHLNKTMDVKVYENAFINPSGTVNSVTATAFFSENNATNVNAFSKNTIAANYHVGAWVWGENRNLRMRCNQFSTPANAAILVQGNLRDQGLPDGVKELQGCDSANYPAANQFMWLPSHSSACGVSPESSIKVDTSKSNFRFYYNTQSVEGPGPSTPKTPDPLCRTSTYGDREWKYNACGYTTPGGKFGSTTCDNGSIFNIVKPPHEDVPCEEVMPYIDSFQWRVVDYRVSLVGLIERYHDFVHLADQQRIFHGLMKESKDIQVSIRRKCPDSLPILRDYLIESPLWEDKVDLVEEVLRKKDYAAFTTAKAKLDSFPIEAIVYQGQNTLTKLLEDKEDLKFIYNQEKGMLQAETNGDTSFQISESEVEQLFAIQAKQSYAGAVAERVLMKLRDTVFIHPLPSLPSNDTVADINWEQYYNDYPVMIYPNPTEGFIRFEFDIPTPIETASIQIVKVSNPSTYVLIDDFTENFFSRIYDLSDKADGIYIMAIKVNGTIVTAKQFKIQK